MIDDQLTCGPLRFPFSTTFTPSGAIVIVYSLPLCSSSRLIDLSSLVAIDPLRGGLPAGDAMYEQEERLVCVAHVPSSPRSRASRCERSAIVAASGPCVPNST